MTKKIAKTAGIIVAALLLLLTAAYLYRSFSVNYRTTAPNMTGLLITGLIAGGLITYLWVQLRHARRMQSRVRSESHTVVEGVKRVFKIVLAEGQLNEIYNYENTKKLLNFIPSTKKALVIVRAQVMMGYDVEKCRWEIDEEQKRVRLLEFPKPEIFSVETDFNYYYFEDDLFNFIGRNDLQKIQELAKEQVKKAALKSSLTKIAADQMKLLLSEVISANHWQIENLSLIDDYKYPEPEKEKQDPDEPTAAGLSLDQQHSSRLKMGRLISMATDLLKP
ncbi:MAG: DUF4230 domain-containing protein [Proteiniphilum sp.]|jgi:hypothetical protein|nr:DUF4230 domain-containing protein [Proteiniphilum sp.]MDD5619636.1 DUF4230 domain-containing protein [Proteiniphilum sp.]